MLDKRMFAGYSQMTAAVVAGSMVLGVTAGEAIAQSTAQIGQVNAQNAIRSTAIASGQSVDYQTLYVDSEVGSDRSVGVEGQPLQTVTRALEIAAPNTVIVLAPGKYSSASGEVFPLQLKSGVTIQGTPGSRNRTAIIEGGGDFESPTRSRQNVAIVAADRAGIAQVAVSNPDGYGVWVESASPTILESAFVGNRQTGIYVASGSPRVQGSYFAGNKIAGLIVFGVSTASIQNNTFDSTGNAIQVSDGATPEIIGNRITNNEAGLVVIGDANPLLRDNRISGNRRDGIVAVAARTRDIMSSAALASEENFVKASEPVALELAESAPIEPIELSISQPISRPVTSRPITSQLAEETNYTRVPQAADVVPGELEPRPFRLIQPTARQSFQPAEETFVTPPIPADAVPGELASRSVSPLLSQLAPEPAGQPVPITVIPSQPVLVADNSQPSIEADAAGSVSPNSVSPSAGAPGSALAALRSGLSSGEASSDISLRPRAVTGGNTDSPVLRPRNRRREPERSPEPNVRPSAPVNNNRLAVPNSSIPIGSGSSTVFSPPRGGVGSPPAPPSRAQAMGLYYRVFVDAADPFIQDEVRSVVPDAFRTQFEGRTVMQVGAFPTEDEAEDRQRLLENNDLAARVEYIR